MESLGLLAILLAIVVAGYIVVNLVFHLVSAVVAFVEDNAFGIILVVALVFFLWLGHLRYG